MFTFFISKLIACTSESELNSAKPKLSNQEHNQLVLDTKQAILNLDIALVESLSAQIDVNRALPDNSTLLAWAVETQEPKLVRLLLQKGATTDIANGNRFTPIILACRYGNSIIINSLLDHGADPNNTIEDGTSAFQLCAGSTSTIDLARMINQDVNISAENDYGQTPLMWAANFGKVENLDFLVNKGARINHRTNEGYSPLFFAIKSQNLNAVKTAIAHGADLLAIAKDGTSAAQLAVYTSNYEFLNWFASELNSLMAPDVIKKTLTAFDRNGHQLLHAAVNANQPKLVMKLLEFGANSTTVSEPSKLTWRYEANFKTENYYPPQLTPIEIAEQKDFEDIVAILGK
jgi:ankyrin repeat protein